MVMPSVTCHSPSVAANNTTEQLTCVFFYGSHVVCGMGGGGVGGGGGLMMHAVQVGNGPTIGNHVHVQSITPNVLLYNIYIYIYMSVCISI